MKSILLLLALLAPTAAMASPMNDAKSLNDKQASHFAALALKCVAREYPNKPEHVINNASEVQSPKLLHPAFYGCYDWHSSVHGHWMLIRLLKTFPNLPESAKIRSALDANLTAENIQSEVAYMKQPNRQSFERTYGWAWALKLAEELHTWNDADGKRWSTNLQPLADLLAKSYRSFLPKQTYPIRTGVHPNTAFGLAFAHDYAMAIGDMKLRELVEERAKTYFAKDVDVPAAWEPGGADFFSPSLMEADLMRRVLSPTDFRNWLKAFLPLAAKREPKSIFEPAIVTDRSDPQLVHLDGLNLSRAWCMRSIAAALPADDPVGKALKDSAKTHAQAGLKHIASGNYEGEHWLASFAVYMLARPE